MFMYLRDTDFFLNLKTKRMNVSWKRILKGGKNQKCKNLSFKTVLIFERGESYIALIRPYSYHGIFTEFFLQVLAWNACVVIFF